MGVREAAKKVFFLLVVLWRGGGKGRGIKEQIIYQKLFSPTAKVEMAIKLEEGGGR